MPTAGVDDAFVGDMFLERGNGASPEVFTRICQVFGISGLGESNELVEATTFCSLGNREYLGGLADGDEMTIECNYEQGDVNLLAMITDVKNKATRSFQVVAAHSSPNEVFSFSAVCMSWTLNPSVEDRNTISFGLKISGAVTIA